MGDLKIGYWKTDTGCLCFKEKRMNAVDKLIVVMCYEGSDLSSEEDKFLEKKEWDETTVAEDRELIEMGRAIVAREMAKEPKEKLISIKDLPENVSLATLKELIKENE